MKKIFIISVLCAASIGFCDPIVFNAIFTPASCTHRLYHPKDRNVPRPFFSETKLDRKAMTSPIKAMGSGSFLYHKDTKMLDYAISYSNMSSPVVMIHLQIGYPHQDGPIFATIIGRPLQKRTHLHHSVKGKESDSVRMAPGTKFGFVTGSVKLSQLGDSSETKKPEKEEKMLVQGGCYITIHTYLNELGEIRGQLTPLSTKQIGK